ncbi:hypothetical protein Vqi01_24620 [Micromonospora qiuiae]|uniref:Uncharacterized protein n=1 Tax=Micromonospora qiuiae TaxID=502268 RepID=A0ABQ4JAW2_9ACTN|nr:DUF5825 family protein [Micromonospora qiuiae]GIJ27300.1 hypothetical protein Vqi01_24620 [Micromonospora qiuiae]
MTTATSSVIDLGTLRDNPASCSLHVVELPEPLRFGRSPAQDLDLLRLLRAVTSHAVRLRWTLSGCPSFPLHTYAHLLPPSLGLELDDVAHTVAWARDYRYGSFYYRRGPEMVAIKDVRPGQPASRMVIEEGADRFERLAESPDGRPEAGDGELVADAVEAGLAIETDGRALVLPFRMRHWPVPYLSV